MGVFIYLKDGNFTERIAECYKRDFDSRLESKREKDKLYNRFQSGEDIF